MIRFDSMPPEVMQAMCTPMHQILSPQGSITGSLYVGSLSAVQDRELLHEHRISHLVQVLDAHWIPVSEKDGFNCYRIEILDQATVDLKPYLEAACNHIDRALRGGRNVLVHCQQVSLPVLISISIRVTHCIAIHTIHTYRASHAVQPSSSHTSSATKACPSTTPTHS